MDIGNQLYWQWVRKMAKAARKAGFSTKDALRVAIIAAREADVG